MSSDLYRRGSICGEVKHASRLVGTSANDFCSILLQSNKSTCHDRLVGDVRVPSSSSKQEPHAQKELYPHSGLDR
jgi:hypothetical protein